MEERKKILIIKTGYSETLDGDQESRNPSLGDVFRATVLLNLYKEDHVTWVTDPDCFPLLEDNPYIDKILALDFITMAQLESEEFDQKDNEIYQINIQLFPVTQTS